MAYRYDQDFAWSSEDTKRRFVTRRRPGGHITRELLFVPSLENMPLVRGDLLEIHRSLFG